MNDGCVCEAGGGLYGDAAVGRLEAEEAAEAGVVLVLRFDGKVEVWVPCGKADRASAIRSDGKGDKACCDGVRGPSRRPTSVVPLVVGIQRRAPIRVIVRCVCTQR